MVENAAYDPVKDYEEEASSVSAENIRRITGDSMTPAPGVEVNVPNYAKIAAILQLMVEIDPQEIVLKELPSFEQTLVGNFVKKLHTMIAKNLDYGPDNITKAGMRGLLTRTQDKLERAKTLVGDPDAQVNKVKNILERMDSSEDDLYDVIASIDSVVNPANSVSDESLEDTIGDLGNYGDIGVLLLSGAWGKGHEGR